MHPLLGDLWGGLSGLAAGEHSREGLTCITACVEVRQEGWLGGWL